MTDNVLMKPENIEEAIRIVESLENDHEGISSKPGPLVRSQKEVLAAKVLASSNLEACRMAGVSESSYYANRKRNPLFAKIADELDHIAMQMRLDRWMKDADDGLERMRFDRNGKPLIDPRTGEPYIERVIDTAMRIFLLKDRLGMTDQPAQRASEKGSSLQISIHIPEAGRDTRPFIIEHTPQEEPERP